MRGLLVCSLLLAACSHRAGPSTFDRELAALPATDAAYAPPRSPKPRALAPGQWVKQRVVDQDGHHTLVTTKVIGLFGHQVWLERETESEQGTRARKLLVGLGDRNDARTIDVFQCWLKHADGRVEKLAPMLIGAEKPRLQSELAALVLARPAQGQEDIAVSAGRFARAYKARVKERLLGVEVESESWWHPEVPLNGALRTRRVGAPGGSELVAFGLRGAKSVF
ncbi:MAG: hypothetical protein ABW352_23670 [Polyangiales bacterium]